MIHYMYVQYDLLLQLVLGIAELAHQNVTLRISML